MSLQKDLIYNLNSGGFFAGPDSARPVFLRDFVKAGTVLPITIDLAEPTGATCPRWRSVYDSTTSTLEFTVVRKEGGHGQRKTGRLKLTVSGETTGWIDLGVDWFTGTIEDELNALTAVSDLGGLVVSSVVDTCEPSSGDRGFCDDEGRPLNGSAFTVTWCEVGASMPEITATVTEVSPEVCDCYQVTTTGTATENEVATFYLKFKPLLLIDSWGTTIEAPAATWTQDATPEIWNFSISPSPVGGDILLTIDGASCLVDVCVANRNSSYLNAKIRELIDAECCSTAVRVVKTDDFNWTVIFESGTGPTVITADSTGLLGRTYYLGVLNVPTVDCETDVNLVVNQIDAGVSQQSPFYTEQFTLEPSIVYPGTGGLDCPIVDGSTIIDTSSLTHLTVAADQAPDGVITTFSSSLLSTVEMVFLNGVFQSPDLATVSGATAVFASAPQGSVSVNSDVVVLYGVDA